MRPKAPTRLPARSMPSVGAKVEAINVLASPLLNTFHRSIIDRMHDAHLPAIYQWPEIAEDGGLLAYGPRVLLCYRHDREPRR